MNFGPTNAGEAEIFALEGLRADIQYEILKAIKLTNITQADLARKMGVSPAWVSQLLNDDANLTLESIAKVFSALEVECTFVVSQSLKQRASQARVVAPAEPWSEGGSSGAEMRPSGQAAKFMCIAGNARQRRRTFEEVGNYNGHRIKQRAAAA